MSKERSAITGEDKIMLRGVSSLYFVELGAGRKKKLKNCGTTRHMAGPRKGFEPSLYSVIPNRCRVERKQSGVMKWSYRYHHTVDYFPVTAHPQVMFYSSHSKATSSSCS